MKKAIFLCAAFFLTSFVFADTTPYFDPGSISPVINCGDNSKIYCAPGGVKFDKDVAPELLFQGNQLTEYGKYIARLSKCSNFAEKHILTVVDELAKSSEKQNKEINAKPACLHRMFQRVSYFRKITTKNPYGDSQEIQYSPDITDQWAAVVEKALRKKMTGWRFSGTKLGLGMAFHLINTQTSRTIVDGKIFTNHKRFLKINLQNWFPQDVSRMMVQEILSDAQHVDPNLGLWRTEEIQDRKYAVHPSWDTYSIINDLYSLYGDGIFEGMSSDKLNKACSAVKNYIKRGVVGISGITYEDKLYCCSVRGADGKNRCADTDGSSVDFSRVCSGKDESGNSVSGFNQIRNDNSGETAAEIQKYAYRISQEFFGTVGGEISNLGVKALLVKCGVDVSDINSVPLGQETEIVGMPETTTPLGDSEVLDTSGSGHATEDPTPTPAPHHEHVKDDHKKSDKKHRDTKKDKKKTKEKNKKKDKQKSKHKEKHKKSKHH